jgi:putative nucleotidyltransferase with HDIG domain
MLAETPAPLLFLSKLERLKDTYFSSLHIDQKAYLKPHEEGVARLVYLLCQQIGMTEEEADKVSVAASFHDIGKIIIPEAILLKPTRLTLEETRIMRQHTKIGYEILSAFQGNGVLALAARIAYEHHEKFNGSGYPRGLIGEKISLEGRVVAICDCYDALRRIRSYKKGLKHEDALEVLLQECQSFDPDVFKLFLDIEDKIKEYL